MKGIFGVTLYSCIRALFHVAGGFFYATIEVNGLEHVPEEGEPTILCFNHGNSLGDAVVVMRCTPLTLRFCAKDSLWKVPIMGQFVNWSGAVPVYRIRDHGLTARDLNKSMYSAVYDTLAKGDVVGIAPEGTCRFLPYMAKIKTGTARIALGAVRQNIKTNPNFRIKICTCGLTYTHREKFRSDVSVQYNEPIVVDASWLEGGGRFDDYETAVRALSKEIEGKLWSVTINCPDWETTMAAMTAARLHRPLGTKISLTQYLRHLRGWVEILKPNEEGKQEGENATMDADVVFIRGKLLEYQKLLDFKKIKDIRVRQREHEGALPKYVIVLRMIVRAALCTGLLVCAIPGLVVWSPVWVFIKARERHLMSKGPTWNDSIAEMKMLYSFVGAIAITVLSLLLSRGSFAVTGCVLLWLALTVRFYESGLASARSFYTLWKLLFLYESTMTRLRKMRRECKALVEKMSKKLPPAALHAADDAAETFYEKTKNLPWYSLWWYEWTFARFLWQSLMRREKKDWNELLRFNDYNTMNYVE